MGSLAGDWETYWEIAYRYRVLFWIDPDDPFRITRIAIALCEHDGRNLLTTADPQDDHGWRREQLNRVREIIDKANIEVTTLAAVERDYAMPPDRFWQFPERPDPKETRRRTQPKTLQA